MVSRLTILSLTIGILVGCTTPKELITSAESGSPEAQFKLARCYDQGSECPKSSKKAARWYRAAAEQGHGEAAYRLGMKYMTIGDRVEQDLEEAEGLLLQSAASGYEFAPFQLVLLYLIAYEEKDPTRVVDAYAWIGVMDKIGYEQRMVEGWRAKAEKRMEAEHHMAARQAFQEAMSLFGSQTRKSPNSSIQPPASSRSHAADN